MWTLGDRTYGNRLILGAQHYLTTEVWSEVLEATGAELVAVDGKRLPAETGDAFLSVCVEMGIDLLPATSGARTAREAVAAANRVRSCVSSNRIMLEIIGNPAALLDAARELIRQQFDVWPCISDDRMTAEHLVEAGCRVLIPTADLTHPHSGIARIASLEDLRNHLPDVAMIIGGGIARPSQAAQLMEMGYDGVIVNRGIARARDPITMAEAYADAVLAGHMACEAGIPPTLDTLPDVFPL